MLFATGGTFKTLHFPGAGIMLVTGMSLFSFVFLPYLFIRTYRNQPI
jgi:hypothetical protein